MAQSITNPQLQELASNLLLAVVDDCAKLPDVRREVIANYRNNRWWPTTVKDWRLRMLVAGWSTRVSYAHISHYQHVVHSLVELGWDRLLLAGRTEIEGLVRPLGLSAQRLIYLESLREFVGGVADLEELAAIPNDELIERFKTRVAGSGYKVAQCAVLYARGYHCGIVPIDSGLVSMLQPLVPLPLPTGAIAHDIVRKWIEQMIAATSDELRRLAAFHGYELGISRDTPPTWWVHLVLIYYKRLYWNKRRTEGPFRREVEDGPHDPGGVELAVQNRDDRYFSPGLILEGVDGSGKSRLCRELKAVGYETRHFRHSKRAGVFGRYMKAIKSLSYPVCLDRSFFSEIVYGAVIRGGSRLADEECEALTDLLAARGFVVFHLDEDSEVLVRRRQGLSVEVARQLRREYLKLFGGLRKRIPVYYLRLSQLAPGYATRLVTGKVVVSGRN